MIRIRTEQPGDVHARERLLDGAFGPCRFEKTSERLRAGRLPATGLSFVASERGQVIGTVRLWHVRAQSGHAALLLGPLAVDPQRRNRGVGGALVRHATEEARRRGHSAVLLVGDAPYYARFGFSARRTGALALPGPYAQERLLARELVAGALAGAAGLLHAAGERVSRHPNALPSVGRTVSHAA